MVKDSKKYASTGGWGFAQFTDGKPDGGLALTTCFSCMYRPRIVTSFSRATRVD